LRPAGAGLVPGADTAPRSGAGRGAAQRRWGALLHRIRPLASARPADARRYLLPASDQPGRAAVPAAHRPLPGTPAAAGADRRPGAAAAGTGGLARVGPSDHLRRARRGSPPAAAAPCDPALRLADGLPRTGQRPDVAG